MVWTGKIEDGSIGGYRAIASNQMKSNLGAGTNEHGLVCGNWSQAIIGQFGPGFELIVDPFTLKKQALVEFTSFQMVDVLLRYSEAFAKATGLVLS
jgi:predicted phage gp36 major capsid-like protein